MIETYRHNSNEYILLPSHSQWNETVQTNHEDEKPDNALANIARLFDNSWLAAEQLITNTANGRGKVYFFEAMEEKCVLRHYYRGGLAAKVSKDRFVYSSMQKTRAFREMSILSLLFQAGLNVPKPLAARVVRTGACYTADIITGEIEKARELHDILQTKPLDEPIWRAIGESIRKMHNAQAFHPDINVKNILVELSKDGDVSSNVASLKQHKSKISLLDFDSCKIRKGEAWKRENLARFKRSLDKQAKKHPEYHFEEKNWRWLEQGYTLSVIPAKAGI
ncbi:3-deoxy-D-manno-octulosonic acid kinase [Glaciecola sp. MH2013]|nr:3-deoxy-D-manno-octulosonic acid kinase [Glaciecola sp. MH2013]